MFKSAFALTSGRAVNLIVSMVLALVQSRFVGPGITGRVSEFFIPLGYLWIITLGIPSALARELPFYLARGEREKALKQTQTTMTFTLAMAILSFSLFFLWGFADLVKGNYFDAVGRMVVAVSAFFTVYGLYVSVTYRTSSEFVTIAKGNTIVAMSNLVVFPLIFVNPYLGLFAKSTVTPVINNLFLHIKRPFKVKLGLEWESFRRLLVFGFPLVAITYFETGLWTSTQSKMILVAFDKKGLGLFVFANTIISALSMIPNAMADILRPKLAAVYGESSGDIKKTVMAAVSPIGLTFLISTLAVLFSGLFVGKIISWLMPMYVDIIPALKYAYWLVPIQAVTCIRYIFVVSKKTHYNISTTIPGFLVGIGILSAWISRGMELEYVFIPYVLGRFTNVAIAVLIFIYEMTKAKRKNSMKEKQH